jgi:hypothetical protein
MALRGGIATHLTIFASHGDRALAVDHDCRQLAVGTSKGERRMTDVRHYRTVEMAARVFLSGIELNRQAS